MRRDCCSWPHRDEVGFWCAYLDGGPGVFVIDGSMIPNNERVDWLDWTAKVTKDSGIPVWLESVTDDGEDGAMIQKPAKGVPAVNSCAATRYVHSQSAVAIREFLPTR